MSPAISAKKILILIGFFSFALKGNAQDLSHKDLEKTGKAYFINERYSEALHWYLKVDSMKPGNDQVSARIGICYLHTEFKFKALPYLEKGQKAGYNKDNIDFYLGRAYHLNHRFEDAILSYERSRKQLKANDEYDLKKMKAAEKAIEMCRSGIELMKNPIDVKIENLGNKINSKYPEYAPVISADETVLIFTSCRPNTTGGKKDDSNHYFEDIYLSVKDTNGLWSAPVNMGSNTNTAGHDANLGLSPDGQQLFMYRNEDIYFSKLEGSKWSLPQKMPPAINNPKSRESSASINSDEKILFFSSDRPGGLGGLDIYVTKKLPNKQWGPAKNLGPAINTPFDDDAPFIHPDGKTLYFSSKGHNSMGGFDIFTIQYDSGADSLNNLANAGYPINTADDDIFFVWSADGTRAYFSSLRSGDNYGEKDIYVLNRPKTNISLIVLKGKVFSKDNGRPLASTLTVTDNEINKVIGVYYSNSYTGKYTLLLPPGKNYGISVEADKHLNRSENVDIPYKEEYFEIVKDIVMEPLQTGSLTVLNNVFFDFGKSDLKKESTGELERVVKLLKENNSLLIEIAGHTDNIGNENDNHILSENRVFSVINYIVSQGIDSKRLCGKGYGEKFPVAANDSETGRQKNRRTEMIIIDAMKSGEPVMLTCEGYYYSRQKKEQKPDEANIETSENFVKSMPEIYFDKDKSAINPSAKVVLDKWLTFLLTNKSAKISIEGYPDNSENGQHNKVLSEKRANIVKHFFITGGIKEDRMKVIGNGEAAPDIKKSKNRRVEIKIL
jgi:outer membrane protein OmpA-like peptidoglycan-associated protein/tetratricopeptide (TPR) repeat protein